MPVYEFVCRACGERAEEVRAMGDTAPPAACPACGKPELKRAFSRVGVRFSGWGFSRTDALVDDRRGPRKDFKTLQSKAEEIAEG